MSPKRLALLIKILRIAGWICVGVLVVLSWIPREWEARTGLPGQIEHAFAYCGTAAIFAWAYPNALRWPMMAALCTLAGILEVGQVWVPGRTAQVVDFVASSVGGVAGVLIGRLALGRLSEIRGKVRASPPNSTQPQSDE